MQAERRHVAAGCRDAAGRVDGLEPGQQFARLGERRGGRWIEPGERRGVPAPPAREFERKRGEVGFEDLGGRLREQRGLRRLAPEPIAPAGRRAAGAAATLVGGGTRDAHGFEAAHPRCRIEQLPSLESGVHDDTHAVDREAGLGDVGRDDDLAAPVRIRPQGGVLRRGRQLAVQRQHAELLARQ